MSCRRKVAVTAPSAVKNHALTSATARLQLTRLRRLQHCECGEHLSAGGVDSDESVEVSLCSSQLECYRKALRHFAGIRAQVVEADDFVLLVLQANQFAVAVLGVHPFWQSVLERREAVVPHVDVLFAVFLLRRLFGYPTGAVFEWCKDSSWDLEKSSM